MKWLVLALAACGGGHSAPVRPSPRAPAPPAAAAPPPAALDCDALVDHAVALTNGGAKLTEAERASVRARLRDELPCEGLSREQYACAMQATALDALAACDQRTPSSSTSNSSVAPGGMTPAAPRSP